MKRLVLLEWVPQGFSASPSDDLIALTPRACYGLDQRGRSYRIASDFGTEAHLSQIEEAYWEQELAWFDQIDAALQERLPELKDRDLHPAILYGYHLKLLLDNRFIRGCEIATLLKRRYDQVILWSEREGESPTDFFRFSLGPQGVYARLLELLCTQQGIPYEVKTSPDLSAETAGSFLSLWPALKTKLKRWRPTLQALLKNRSSSSQRLTLFFLETGPYLGDLLQEALEMGHRCLIQQGHDVFDPSRLGWRFQPLQEGKGVSGQTTAQWNAAAQELFSKNSPIWKWPDGWFECPMAPLLADFFKGWVTQQLPEWVRLSDVFHRWYAKERVDFVLTPFLTHPLHFPAVAACRRSSSTRSVLVADGDGPDRALAWDLTELFRTQHYFVPNQEFSDYFRERRSGATHPTAQVHVEGSRWNRYTRLSRRPRLALQRWDGRLSLRLNRPPLPVPAGRPVIVYVVAKLERDVRLLNRPDYSETWYDRLQTALLKAFANLPEYTFIIKLLPTPDTRPSVVEQRVKDLHVKHMIVSRSPFHQWLPWADRVILDLPSTTLYETTLAGVAFHLLVYRKLAMRPTGLAPFTCCLSLFDEPSEAVSAITNYLRSPHTGKPSIRPEGPPLLTTLSTLVPEEKVAEAIGQQPEVFA